MAKVSEASEATSIHKNTLYYHIGAGELAAQRRNEPVTVSRREEVIKFLEATRRQVDLEQYPDEWFTINKLVTSKIANYSTIYHAIRLGEVQTQKVDASRPFIHLDELNRFLQASPVRPKSIRENIQPRIEIMYTPIFTGVQSSWG